MPRLFFLVFTMSISNACLFAQDSAWVQIRPKYDKVSGLHRFLFGENYRKEWSDSTYLPIIDLSKIEGGLKPIRLGGGHQTVSLRLTSARGNEWVLRNIEKDASILLPPEIRQTFAREVIDDAMSAQHPFSPLVVAELAEAANVPHANPIIGIIKQDTFLGEFSKAFAGRVCLIEEREPMGNSDNSLKMFAALDDDNDNSINGEAFMKARLLDLLIGDWDRHADQWRWVDTRKGKTKFYIGIPRDRDQAFYLNQGLFPGLASKPWFVPSLQGFKGEIRHPKYSLKEGAFLYSRPALHMPYEKWIEVTEKFTQSLSDEVLRRALLKLPASAQNRRSRQLFQILQQRRDGLLTAIQRYYRFLHKTVDIQLSNKHELVNISKTDNDELLMQVDKRGRNPQPLYKIAFDPAITKEIRVYTGKGNDSVIINTGTTPIKLRIIGEGITEKVNLGANSKVKIHDDTLYVPTNRYNILKPLVAGGFNRDDGLLIGAGLQYTRQGFRKLPYASLNRLVLYYSFATSAYRLRYSGEWNNVLGKTDIIATADVFAPQNTQNFFGRGNETKFNRKTDDITFYRTRFSLYTLTAGFRWTNNNGLNIVLGPTFQHYRFDSSENKGRILNTTKTIYSYDSSSVARKKTHAGAMLSIGADRRNNKILPVRGYAFSATVHLYGGLNNYSKSFAQFQPQVAMYVPLNRKRSIVLADRIGAGFTAGKSAFYQSMFAGGHNNLLGYRQYRFAGEHVLYNNLEMRMRLANFTGYIIPGEFGMLGFYDLGRVWLKDEQSDKWHQGAGGGLYFAPAKLAVISVVAGHSVEGWYPYIKLGFRF